jgi:hypothetical protein
MGEDSKMNNEPVAWGWYDLEIKRFFPHWDEDLMENKEGCIPLYTHPAKTLTDDEIEEFAYAFELWQLNNPDKALEGIKDFARAILKKASEK